METERSSLAKRFLDLILLALAYEVSITQTVMSFFFNSYNIN